MLIVMIAIGTTDLLFALDSIPAIFGLTKESYLVFTANAFALMGLRQLYFLLGGLLDRLVYLNKGLAFILAFIGIKLVMEALHATGFEQVPEVPDLAVAGRHRRRDAGDHGGEPASRPATTPRRRRPIRCLPPSGTQSERHVDQR